MKKTPKRRTTDRHKGKMFGVRLSPELAEKIKIMAEREKRTGSNMIAVLLDKALAQEVGQ